MSFLSKVNFGKLKNPQTLISLLLNVSLILLMLNPLLYPQAANAATSEAFVRFDRLSTGAAISGTACMKSTLITQTNVIIVFPVGWTISQTVGNWTANTTGIVSNMKDPVGGAAAEAWPGIGNANSVSGLNVQFPGTAFTAGHFYCFNFAGATSTVGSAGNDQTGQFKTQGGSPYTDSVNFATSVVSSGGEQITVSASVSATMTFSLSGNTIALGTLSTSSVTSGNVTQTVSTNARNGYVSWLQGTSTTGGTGGGLHSSAANADIPSPGSFPTITDLASSTGVVIDAVTGTNSPTINAGYAGNGSSSGGHFDGGTFHEVSSKTGPQSGSTVVLNVRAKIASTQAAASDYSDVLTVVAAGSF